MRFCTLIIALVLVLPLQAAKKTGIVCIAAFHVGEMELGPNMSQTTWAPSPGSTFEFRIGKNIKATVPADKMVTIRNVPADRKVIVGIRLDGKPYESFPIDLRKERGRRACLWLYEGYWHWVNTGWNRVNGCRCGG